jgi:hypothetical protein
MISTFITIDATDTAQIISYASDFVDDTSPLLIIVVSVGMGILIFTAIVNAIKH